MKPRAVASYSVFDGALVMVYYSIGAAAKDAKTSVTTLRRFILEKKSFGRMYYKYLDC